MMIPEYSNEKFVSWIDAHGETVLVPFHSRDINMTKEELNSVDDPEWREAHEYEEWDG